MKKIQFLVWIVLLIVPLIAWAGYSPTQVKTALKRMYPSITEVAWSQQENYYVGNFMLNGFDTDVWFDGNANWVMTLTDLQTTDELSAQLYNAFAMSEYGSWEVENVTQATFPKHLTVFVIKIGQPNIDNQYQLFYKPNGDLIRIHGMGYTEGTLYPECFIDE